MIKIKTRLHAGILKSAGGDPVLEYYKWKTKPKKLIKAAEVLPKHIESMTMLTLRSADDSRFEHNESWVELDGVKLLNEELEFILVGFPTPREQARDLSNRVRTGQYQRDRKAFKRELEQMYA